MAKMMGSKGSCAKLNEQLERQIRMYMENMNLAENDIVKGDNNILKNEQQSNDNNRKASMKVTACQSLNDTEDVEILINGRLHQLAISDGEGLETLQQTKTTAGDTPIEIQ